MSNLHVFFLKFDCSFLWSTIPARSRYWLLLLSHWASIFCLITLAAISVCWPSVNSILCVRVSRIGLEWAFPSMVPSDWRFCPRTLALIIVSPIGSAKSAPTYWSYVPGSASSLSRIAGDCPLLLSSCGLNDGVSRLSSSGSLEKSSYLNESPNNFRSTHFVGAEGTNGNR